MDRKIRVSIIVVVIVALAYPAAAWLLGLMVEHQWEQREQLALEKVPYIALIKRDYRRGVYSSTEEVTYGLDTSMQSTLAAMGNANLTGGVPTRFVLRNTIHHGPLPQLRAFAPATVDSRIVLPAAVQQKLAAAIGSQGGLTIHTRVKWLGGSTTLVHGDAVQWKTPDGGELNWRGVDARVDLGRELGSESIALRAPGFGLKGPAVNVNLENLEISADQKLAFGTLNAGPARMTLGHVDIEAPAREFKASARNLSLDARSSIDGDYLSSGGSFDLDTLQVGKFAASKAGYEIHFDHLHGPSAAALIKSLRTAEAPGAVNATAADFSAKILEPFKTSGSEILLHEPVLRIPRLGFKTPDGELLVAMNLTLPGVTRAELDGPPEFLKMTLMKHLRAAVDARIDTALLDKLLDSTGKGDTITAQLQGLQRQGYIKLEGKALTTHLAFQDSRLKVNDLPFPPMPTAAPGMPGGPVMPGGPGMHHGPGMPGPGVPSAPH